MESLKHVPYGDVVTHVLFYALNDDIIAATNGCVMIFLGATLEYVVEVKIICAAWVTCPCA